MDGQPVQRLKTRREFQAVLATPAVAQTLHFALHSAPASPAITSSGALAAKPCANDPLRFAAMVPKRWARRAVTRNAIKRQIYAVGALFQTRLKPLDHLIRLRAPFESKLYPSARSQALKQAVRIELLSLLEQVVSATDGGSAAGSDR